MILRQENALPERFIHKPDFAKLVTAADLKNRPIYNWFYFPHSFSPQLVSRIVEYWQGDGRGSIESVLDPFVGAGTTLLAAKNLGITAVGADLSPLAVFITKAKLESYDYLQISDEVEKVIQIARMDTRRYKTTDTRMVRAFTPAEHANLKRLRKAIYLRGDNGLLVLAFLNVLRETSRAYADGGWFRWVEKSDSWRAIFAKFRAIALNFAKESNVRYHNGTTRQDVFLSDARSLTEISGKFDAIVTSPPYPNKHDYTRVFHLELLLGMGLHDSEVSELRYTSLRSHVEAKKPETSSLYVEAEGTTLLLERIKKAGADIRVERMLRGYLEDMYTAFLRMHERLSPHGRIALVVSNVRHGGVMFPVDEILVEVAAQAGFDWDQTWVARHRGNSAQQMSLYGRDPARESIVLLHKR